MSEAEAIVLVTGFGPFGEHKINASWQAVQLLPDKLDGFKIEVEEIPVIYNHIDEHIPLLWRKHNPKLVVHVGVSNLAQVLTIETQAFRTGYSREDCIGNTRHNGEVCPVEHGQNCIKGNLDIDEICDFMKKNSRIRVCKSMSAGRYLCEFIFYKSLSIDPDRTLFIHVPPLNEPYSAEELAEGIVNVIKCALKQVCSCKD